MVVPHLFTPRTNFKLKQSAEGPPARHHLWVVVVALLLVCSDSNGQTNGGSTQTAVAGGALGLASGATLGLTGSLVPCTQTYAGATCVRWATAVGGAIGLASGMAIGAADSDRIERAGTTAGIGAAVGVAAGLAASRFAQRFGWADVATIGLLGGAVGAMPRGAGIGVLVGGAAGVVLWQFIPGVHLPDAVGFAVAGLALGSLTQWVWSAADARREPGTGTQLLVPLTIRF